MRGMEAEGLHIEISKHEGITILPEPRRQLKMN